MRILHGSLSEAICLIYKPKEGVVLSTTPSLGLYLLSLNNGLILREDKQEYCLH